MEKKFFIVENAPFETSKVKLKIRIEADQATNQKFFRQFISAIGESNVHRHISSFDAHNNNAVFCCLVNTWHESLARAWLLANSAIESKF